MVQIIRLGIPICICFFGTSSRASTINGRITLGGYAAQEKFADSSAGSARNDFLTASARYYLRAGDLGAGKNWQITTDLRDKHDFFEKLDKELLQLDPVNTFQTRELNLRYVSQRRSTFLVAGRFPVSEAGNVHSDGVLWGYKPNEPWTLGIFGGLNPKRPDQQYLSFNEDSKGYGLYGKYQSTSGGWNKNSYASLALVQQMVGSDTDRFYLYENILYQWSGRTRFFNMFYLDFVPQTKIQTGFLSWIQEVSTTWDLEMTVLGVDVIEYLRRQGVREQLSPSPYKEGTVVLKKIFTPKITSSADFTYGKRDSDDLIKREYGWKLSMPRLFSANWDTSLRLIHRDNFTSRDSLYRISTGYFSDSGELSVEFESGTEEYFSGSVYHPVMVQGNFGFFFSKTLFAALSLENIKDERVEINSGFFKISYRFGNQEIPPIRDGAAPRGTL